MVDKDDGIRPDISVATLGALKPVFKKGGTTTAGNSSQVGTANPVLPMMGPAMLLPAMLTFVKGGGTMVHLSTSSKDRLQAILRGHTWQISSTRTVTDGPRLRQQQPACVLQLNLITIPQFRHPLLGALYH